MKFVKILLMLLQFKFLVSWKLLSCSLNIYFLFKNSSKIEDVDFTVVSNKKYNLVTYNITRSKGDMTFNVLFNQTVDLILAAKVDIS